MNKLIPIIPFVFMLVILTSCGHDNSKSQRYAAVRLNDRTAILIDQKTGKTIVIGYGSDGWGTPRDLKIDWDKK